MLYVSSDEYDWQARRDAEIMQDYQSLKSDPQRVRKARDLIKKSVMAGRQALKDTPVPPEVPGRRNPATIGPLKTRY